MLVLSRSRDETIICTVTPEDVQKLAQQNAGLEIVITCVSAGLASARLGIDAPREVTIVRGELVTVEAAIQGTESQ